MVGQVRDMLLGCIADDFTGASDLANTLAKGGMRTVQFNGIPGGAETVGCEAAVVALKTRSVPAEDAVARSLEALEWLRAQGCRQFVFKYCSTFDSTPQGNIGPVAEALLAKLGAPSAVVCPAFPATGRTLFMGHLFVGDALLSESGMEHHPLNPMTDANIRRWLGRQVSGGVGLVRHGTVRQGATTIRKAIDAEAREGRPLVVVDAVSDEDLRVIGEAAADDRLVTGGSGIALGLPENFRRMGLLRQEGTGFAPVKGRGVILSGSCSRTSQEQVASHLQSHPGLPIAAADLISGGPGVAAAVDFVRRHRDGQPLVYSTADPETVRADQERYGRDVLASRIETFFGDLATALVKDGVRRLVVGGGETSGAVVTALGVHRMLVGPEIDPGVPALAEEGRRGLRLALKSGNFGAVDFFAKALATLGDPE